MNIFKLKFKMHQFVNILFYFIIFIIGFLFGIGIGNVKAYTSSDSIPSNAYYQPLVNFYLDETEDEYNNHKYGYNNGISYSNYQNKYNELNNHHVYDFLQQVTEYLIQNSSNDYDFLVFYHDADNYESLSYMDTPINSNNKVEISSAIYIYYYPKGANLDELDIWNTYSSKYFYGVGSFNTSNICLAQSNCNNDFVPGSGLDVIPVSLYERYKDDKGYSRTRIIWPLDSVYDYSDNFNIIDYYEFSPFYTYYRTLLLSWLDELPSFTEGWSSSSKTNFINRIQGALSDEYFLYPKLHETFVKPFSFRSSGIGWLMYYSTLPLIYSRESYVNVIGSKVFYTGDEFPTYANEKNISFEILSNEQKTINYLNDNGYRMFCADTQSVIISPGIDSPNNIDLFFLENIFDIDREIYFNFYNYNLTDFSLSSILDTPVYLSSNNLSDYNFPNFLSGYSYYNYSFVDNNNLVVSRTDFEPDSNKINTLLDLLTHPFTSYHDSTLSNASNFYYFSQHGVIFLDDNHSNYSSYDSSLDGDWCFYVTDGVYVQSLTTQNSDDNYKNSDDVNDSCNKSDISFSGQVMTENGLVEVQYVNPFCKTDENVWKYSDSFMTHNKTTFTFLTNISHYFFTNVDNRFFEGFLAIILIILFIKMCSYFGGGN